MPLETTLRDPVQLLDPFSNKQPEPDPDCDVCGALIRQWREASDPRSPEYNPSKASDIAVELQRHRGRK